MLYPWTSLHTEDTMYEYGTSLAVTNRLPKLTIRNNGHLLECDSFPVQKEIAFK